MKMYVLVNRSILNLPQCSVQAAHSVAEFMNTYHHLDSVKDWINNHQTLIILEASEEKMKEICEGFD